MEVNEEREHTHTGWSLDLFPLKYLEYFYYYCPFCAVIFVS